MVWESNKRMWEALRAVHQWLTVDFVDTLGQAGEITQEDWKPLLDARQCLTQEQFSLDHEVYHLATRAIDDSLLPALGSFVDAFNQHARARESGDRSAQHALQRQLSERYNTLVKRFERQLHEVKAAVDTARGGAATAASPSVYLPALVHVGGSIIIGSPYATQENTVTHAGQGATITAPRTVRTAIGAQRVVAVADRATRKVHESRASADVKELVAELARRIAALDPAAHPEQVQQLADDLKTLGNEIAKVRPRRKWYALSLEGIKEAARALGEVGKPIVEIALKLVPLLVRDVR